MSGFEGNNTSTCVVCYKNVEIYSIGMCEHPVCHECSTRMRVLCRQNECPICRQDLPEVVFTHNIQPFKNPKNEGLLARYNIYFENAYIQKKFNELLAENCTVCRQKKTFENFEQLRDHMKQEHQLYHCDLCVENLKIFPRERRWYTRPDLSMHRRKGDLDDRSHRGHPLCEFCTQRYMDNDELYRHLRRDHLYCHFCDEDGLHQYYDSYDYLRDHFRLEHYLCEEGECAEEKFTSVFRTDIDLKAHRSSAHSKQLSKAAAKQARTLELEFTLAPRERMRRIPFQNRRDRDFTDGRDNTQGYVNTSNFSNFQNSQGSQHSPHFQNSQNFQSYQNYQNSNSAQNLQQFAGPGTSRDDYPCYLEPTFMRPQVDVQSTEEFPTLGSGTGMTAQTFNTSQKGRGNVTIRSTMRNQKLAVTDENFPALGPESSISKTVNVSLSGNSGGNLGNGTSNVSIQVNHEGNGTVMRVSGPNIRIRPSLKIDSEFPVLGGGEAAAGGNGSSGNNGNAPWKEVLQWTCSKTNSKTAVGSKKKNTAPAPTQQPIHGEDFPTLSKSKKQSTLTMVPTWGPQAQNSTSQQQNAQGASNNGTTKGKTKKKKEKRAGGGGADGGSKKDAIENMCAENFESIGTLGRLGNAVSSRSGAENAESFCNSTKNIGKVANSSKSAYNYESLDNVGHSKSGASSRNADNLENFDYFNNTANSGNSGNSRNFVKPGNEKNSENSESSLNFGTACANTKSASSSNSLNSQSSLIAQKGSNSQKDEQTLRKDKRKQRVENKGNNCCTSLSVTNSSQNPSNSHNSKNSHNSSDSNDSNSDSNQNSKSTTNLTLHSNVKTTAKSSSNCNSISASKSPTKSSSNVNLNSSSKSSAAKSSSSSTGQNASKSQRKRTELKIDSLNANSSNSPGLTNSKNSNNSSDNSNSYGEYPAPSSAAAKPPGFTQPPPGFTKPPPGFSIKYNLDNNLTFTNSSGETYSILPDRPCDDEKQFTTPDVEDYHYTPPTDFQERNKRLVAKLNDVLLEQDNIEEFRRISGLFRQGSCPPDEYYEHCRRVLGNDAFRQIFPELLLLLPDIKQQQELFRIYSNENDGITWLEECRRCGQVLRAGREVKNHFDGHERERDFPELGKGSASGSKNNWVRK